MRSAHKRGCIAAYIEGQLRLLRIDKAVELPSKFNRADTVSMKHKRASRYQLRKAEGLASQLALVKIGYPNRMPNLIKPLPSRDAIHEAGHAVVAAVMGMPDIWITVASKRLQCECGSNTPSTYEALAVSYGGYTADTHINLLPESDCLRRSTTDAKHREQIVKSHAPMYHEHIDWSSKLERAKEAAVTVAMVRTEDIIQVAREIDKYIETKIDVPCEIVEQWQGIQDARAFGEAMRKKQPDVPIP